MKSPDNKSFWQRFARLYGPAMKGAADLYKDICRRIGPRLKAQDSVLELACGSGQLSFRLADRVQVWEATDFSPAMIGEAKKGSGPRQLHFSVQDATALPYGDQTFDAVVIANALHIMPHPEQALVEIRRVLKPGGLLFAPTFVMGCGFRFTLRMRVMELAGFHTFHPWTQQEFLDWLPSHGFRVTDQTMLGTAMMPLCYAEATPEP